MNGWRLGVALWTCWLATAAAAEPRVTLEPEEKWLGVLGDSEVKFHYTVRATETLEGQVNWSLSVNRRTINRGHAVLTVGPEKPARATLPLRIPPVKDGVILEAQLTVAAYASADSKPAAVQSKPVEIFAPDPFADRGQWLRGLGITLFDPEKKTADRFDKAHIPFKFTGNTSMLDQLNEGLLVVGEGTAWRDYPSLGESVVKAASRGVPVLCLAPGEGTLALPGAEAANLPVPAAVTLRQEDVIRQFDKRLDWLAWPPNGEITVSRLAIKSDRDQVVAEIGRGNRGWPWLDVRYPAPQGRLFVCGFGIVRYWEAGPAPRYLLAELLARLSAEK